MIGKFTREYGMEALGNVLGPHNARFMFSGLAQASTIHELKNMDLETVFATTYGPDEVWLCGMEGHPNNMAAWESASRQFRQCRAETEGVVTEGVVTELVYRPKIQEGTIIQANEGDPDSGSLYLEYRPITHQERATLMVYYSNSDISLVDDTEMGAEPYD